MFNNFSMALRVVPDEMICFRYLYKMFILNEEGNRWKMMEDCCQGNSFFH